MTTQNDFLIQLIRDGGLVVRQTSASPWSRMLAACCPHSRWRRTDERSVHITVAEVGRGGTVEEFIGLAHAEVEVCRFTGDRRYGHTVIHTTPGGAAGDEFFPLVRPGPLLEPRRAAM